MFGYDVIEELLRLIYIFILGIWGHCWAQICTILLPISCTAGRSIRYTVGYIAGGIVGYTVGYIAGGIVGYNFVTSIPG